MLTRMRWPDTCYTCEHPKPRSFAALMELYEQNYMRLKCLCPELKRLKGHIVSRVGGAHDLHLTVLEQVKHTTTLILTYEMQDGERRPDVIVRVYHDALAAEVLSHRCRLDTVRLVRVQDQPLESALQCRWRVNRFLYKWLNYVHRQGHGFPLERSARRVPVLDGDQEVFEIFP